MTSVPATIAPFHIVLLQNGMVLLRAPHRDWTSFQEHFTDFQTSIGPYCLEALLDTLFDEWPHLAWREAEVRAWATGESDLFDLEGPALQ